MQRVREEVKKAGEAGKRVVIFRKRDDCPVAHPTITLICTDYGADAEICNVVDVDDEDSSVEMALLGLLKDTVADGGGRDPYLPAVFIGGAFVGGANTIIHLKLNGTLRDLLLAAGAIYL